MLFRSRDWLLHDVMQKAEANLRISEEEKVGQPFQTDMTVAACGDNVDEPSKAEIAQVSLLIKSLDQIITDAVLLKNELSKSF